MKIVYLSSYDRSFKELTLQEQEVTGKAIDQLINAIVTGNKPAGLGLKKCSRGYWEIRINISKRVIFSFITGGVVFSFVGDHNAVRKFLNKN